MTIEAPVQVAEQAAAVTKPVATMPMNPTSGQSPVEPVEKEPTVEEMKALEALPELRSAAETACAAGNFTEAVEKLSDASEILAKAYGPLSPKCAEILLMYGRALYRVAAEQNKIAKENGVGAAEKTACADADNATKGEEANPESEGEADEEEEENATAEAEEVVDEKDDLQTAFEILDTARVILSKMDGESAQKMLAEAHMLLGDVSLECENYPRAVTDFQSALETAAKVYPPTDRTIACIHYKLASALEWDNSVDKAVEEVQKVVGVLKLRADLLTSGEITVSHETDAEIKEILQLIPDVEAKINELKETPKVNTLDSLAGEAANMFKLKRADAAEFLAERLAQSDAADNSASAISFKRKAEDIPADSEEAKKIKEAATPED